MKIIAAFCIVLAMSGLVHADAIDDYVNAELTSQHIPGAAVAIMQNGTRVRAQGYGFANIELRAPVHPDTIFQSGSIGKQFTATAIMLMVEDGKLRLDESIRTYLPQAPKSWAPITVRHLLTHTSGLPSDSGSDLHRDYTDDEMLSVFYNLRLEFPAGKRWSYSNTGYELLGILVKKVSGISYSDVLAARVFAPLHMSTARLVSDRDIVMNRAAGYEFTDTGLRNQDWVAPTANSTGDGSLYLTVLDFARWDAGLRAGRILKPESWAEVYRPVRLTSGKTYPYGFGWILEESAGQEVHQHSGGWQGFTTFFIRYLTDDVSVVVLTNLADGDPMRIARGVAGLYNAKLALPTATPIEDSEPGVTSRTRHLLDQVISGTARQRDFGIMYDSARSDYFAQQMGEYREELQTLGTLQEFRLFEVRELGDDRAYRYRGRFEKGGPMEVRIVLQPDGLLSQFFMSAAPAWNAPLQP